MKRFSSLLRGGFSAALLLLLWLVGPAARAQAPVWQSATFLAPSGGGTGYSSVRATTSDANGNIYLVGEFGDHADFGPITLTATTGGSLFVAKYNAPTSTFVWVQQVANVGNGLGNPTTLAVAAVSLQGTSVYVAGTFTGTVGFGNTTLNSSGGTDAFVAKVVDAGSTAQFGWVQQSTGTGNEEATGLAVNGAALYLTGTFGGPGASSTAVLGTTTLTSASPNRTDIFVAKLFDAGTTATFGWALRVGGSDNDQTNTLVVNGANLYLGGYVSSQAVFGTIVAPLTTSTRPGFVAKLVDNGTTATFAWVQVPGGQTNVFALAVSGSNVYVAGALSDYSYFTTFGSVQLVSAGRTDGFVAKLVDVGATSSFVWARNFGSSDYDEAFAVAVRNSAVYVGGGRSGQAYLGRYTDAGTTSRLNWELTNGYANVGSDQALAVAVVSGGQVYVAGSVTPPSSFAPIPVIALPRIRTGFLASAMDAIPTTTTAAQGTLSFALAPNPARAATSVQLPALPGAATATLCLQDALGRPVRTATLPLPAAGLRHELRLDGLAPGLYTLQVQAGAATATRQLVVE